jgi:hypothetical protein
MIWEQAKISLFTPTGDSRDTSATFLLTISWELVIFSGNTKKHEHLFARSAFLINLDICPHLTDQKFSGFEEK